MSLEVVGSYRDLHSIKEECKTYLSYHAVLIMDDGSTLDGIIEGVDDNSDEIVVLAGEDVVIDDNNADNMSRQQPMGYNRPNRYRRFRRRRFPINRIIRLELLRYPFIYPIYPYPYPFFPY